MARKYKALWDKIANREAVSIICHKSAMATIRKAMQKEKYLHKRARQAVDLPSFGIMTVKISDVPNKPEHVRLSFELSYSGDNL